jgi:hypothetical protein
MDVMPYPGELRNMIKAAITFSDPAKKTDYFVKLYRACNGQQGPLDGQKLKDQGFTLREMEVLTGHSKSKIARELAESA